MLRGCALGQEPLPADAESLHDDQQAAGTSLAVLALAVACLSGGTSVPAPSM